MHLHRFGPKGSLTRFIALAVLALGAGLPLGATAAGADGFNYDGGKLPFLQGTPAESRRTVFAAWNPTGADQRGELLRPGMKVTFWGHAPECQEARTSGPVTTMLALGLDEVARRTGVRPSPSQPALRWTPTGGGVGCSPESERRVGPAFVVASEEPVTGGIGLFASSGTGDEREFLRPFSSRGQGGIGANRGIQGTFVTFRLPTKGAEATPAFGGSTASKLVVQSTQTVPTFRVGRSFPPNAEKPSQVKQQISVALINPTCLSERRSKFACQFKYLLHTAVMREGVRDWNREGWFQMAAVLLDPAQGGIPVLHGPVMENNERTRFRDVPGATAWISRGAATQHAEFGPTPFVVEIGFENFKTALKVAVARGRGKKADAVDDSEVAEMYGSSWKDSRSWQILSIAVGQEVHSNNATDPSWIGGGVKSLQVKAQDI